MTHLKRVREKKRERGKKKQKEKKKEKEKKRDKEKKKEEKELFVIMRKGSVCMYSQIDRIQS